MEQPKEWPEGTKIEKKDGKIEVTLPRPMSGPEIIEETTEQKSKKRKQEVEKTPSQKGVGVEGKDGKLKIIKEKLWGPVKESKKVPVRQEKIREQRKKERDFKKKQPEWEFGKPEEEF